MKVGGWTSCSPDRLVVCRRCGCAGLAWATSKAGRPYLCYTRRVNSEYSEAYWIMPNAPHSCEEYKARAAAAEKARADAQKKAHVLDSLGTEEYVALLDELNAAPFEARAGILRAWTDRQAAKAAAKEGQA